MVRTKDSECTSEGLSAQLLHSKRTQAVRHLGQLGYYIILF